METAACLLNARRAIFCLETVSDAPHLAKLVALTLPLHKAIIQIRLSRFEREMVPCPRHQRVDHFQCALCRERVCGLQINWAILAWNF